ncbi:type II toxin-antitoxin system RelE/ParE family toxin [Foetidibacter luteolus]|uniref:type II toxin-antitoxin system RelE/ParE family toxin n=1 Tax=Foetidibacter luteolus TaxID=2608880 RepID=UPI00129BCA01|nr:type II toxin-antitoxin system RelE/ParE family toxin [Foetidibacter luteolus]
MVVTWSKKAQFELRKAYDYIFQDSPKNALKVTTEIVNTTLELPKHPEKFPPDKYKKSNDGSWRAFEQYHYRISYRIVKDQIRIVRMRHTSRSPLKY